jgi:inosine-uridine nucleoside N-ribohydrolase
LDLQSGLLLDEQPRRHAGRTYATAYLFTETSFPIAIVPLDVCDKLPIPGQFMDTLRAANSSECNQGIYEALLVSYDTFAAEQPFYRLWDSGAVMYYPVHKS